MAQGVDALAEFLQETKSLPPDQQALIRQEVFDAKLKPQWGNLSRQEQLMLQSAFNSGLPKPLMLPPIQDYLTKQAMGPINAPGWAPEDTMSVWQNPQASLSDKVKASLANVAQVGESVRRGLTPPMIDNAVNRMAGRLPDPKDPRSQGGILPPWMHLGPAIGGDIANEIGVPQSWGEMSGAIGPGLAAMLMRFPRLGAPLVNFFKSQMRSPILEGFQAGRVGARASGAAAGAEVPNTMGGLPPNLKPRLRYGPDEAGEGVLKVPGE